MLVAAVVSDPASAAPSVRFDIPAGSLEDAMVAFGTQSGTTIGTTGALAGVRSSAVKGKLPVQAALRRLLSGTGFDFEAVDAQTFRIFRRPSPVLAARSTKEPTTQPSALPMRVKAEGDIIVTASKRDTTLQNFAGSVHIVDNSLPVFDRWSARGTEALVQIVGPLNSTNLGPGRNKLIIGGVADSSFTGPSQAVVGQYLGDIRLNYNAPDPDLNLYDMERVEVLEGPQGTLYGSGSIGGILRLVPNTPDLSQISGDAMLGLLTTRHGGSGSEAAAMFNIPISEDRAALRLVGYRTREGGYIDDVGRNLKNINRSHTDGARAVLRFKLGETWVIDAGGLFQNINNADSQYALKGFPPNTRSSAIAQPFDNDYRLAQIVVSRHWDGKNFVSATGYVRHDVHELFDATMPSTGPRAFEQSSDINLFSNETRLSKHKANGAGWLIGTSFIANIESVRRTLGPLNNGVAIAGVRNSVTAGALYGEWTYPVTSRLNITAGGRLSYTHLSGELLDRENISSSERKRTERDIVPTAAITWRPTVKLTAYLRYQEGYRGGGLTVASSGSGIISQRFLGDSIATFEAGLRYGDPAHDRISGFAALNSAHWEHIQADLIDSGGLPYTANIGNGRVRGAEVTLRMRPSSQLLLEGGLFYNDSDLTDPASGFEASLHRRLPNTARLGAKTAMRYNLPLSDRFNLTVNGSARYYGHSRLGVNPGFDFHQGGYFDTALGLQIATKTIGLSLDITNLLNERGNRFSFGNPFGVMDGRQITPQRPRTFRLGIDGRF